MKLVVRIEPAWFHGVHEVEVELDPADYDFLDMSKGMDQVYFNNQMQEVAQDLFNNEVSWGWEVIND